MYIQDEIVNILSPHKDRSPIKIKLMDEILIKQLVSVGRTQFFVLLKDHKEGRHIIDNDWYSCGQPRSLKDKYITNHSDTVEEKSGQTIGQNELLSIIKDI